MPRASAGASNHDLDQRFFSQPIRVAIVTAILGLVASGGGILLQARANTQLERQKFETSLITRALETPNKEEAARSLLFLVDAGLVQSLDTKKLKSLAATPQKLPSFLTAVASGQTTVVRIKRGLASLGLFSGPIDETVADDLRQAIRKFQIERGMAPDGIVGPATAQAIEAAVGSRS